MLEGDKSKEEWKYPVSPFSIGNVDVKPSPDYDCMGDRERWFIEIDQKIREVPVTLMKEVLKYPDFPYERYIACGINCLVLEELMHAFGDVGHTTQFFKILGLLAEVGFE